jgi:thiol:disulfide interchange protein DsbG
MFVSRLCAIFSLCLGLLVVAFPAQSAERLSTPLKEGSALARAADSMLTDIRQATWIRDGKSAHVMYVFFDPNCPYCRRVYENLRPQVEFGEVELRWIPVGILMTTSLGKAAAMLEAKNPADALHRNEERFSTDTGAFGGVEEEPVPRDDTLRRLALNLALLRRSGRDAVPSLLYRDKRGQAHFLIGSRPAETLEKMVKELE